ncbi:MAG: hypothetical protein GY700_13560 [Propionibacteriaceae bacterium]|nr:hypothetical protein [Propionibacteriaceae bacterium]
MRQELEDKVIEVMREDFQCFTNGRCATRSSRVRAFLECCIPGDSVPYEVLNHIIGMDVGFGKKGDSALSSAINYCARNRNLVFSRPKGERRIVCLHPKERMQVVKGGMQSIRRKARIGSIILEGTNTSGFTIDEINERNALNLQHRIIEKTSSPMETKKIADATKDGKNQLPMHLEKLLNG